MTTLADGRDGTGRKFSLSDLQPVKPGQLRAAVPAGGQQGQRQLLVAPSPFPNPAPNQLEKPVYSLESLQSKAASAPLPQPSPAAPQHQPAPQQPPIIAQQPAQQQPPIIAQQPAQQQPPIIAQQQEAAECSLETEHARLLERVRLLELELQAKRQAGQTCSAHVFIDNSNLMYGARNMPDGSRDERVLLDVDALVGLMTAGMPCASRFVAGSNIPEAVRRRWEGKSFKVMEVLRAPGTGEQFVDEALHSCISRVILEELPQTLVLGTGDGNEKEGTNSFPGLARSAARKGWKVVIWGWMSSTSPRFYDVKREFPDRIEIKYLDDHREAVTFITSSRQSSSPTSTAPKSQSGPKRTTSTPAPRPSTSVTLADFIKAQASPRRGSSQHQPKCPWGLVVPSQM